MKLSARTKILIMLSGIFVILIFSEGTWKALVSGIAPDPSTIVYNRAPFHVLVWEHIGLVFISSSMAILIGLLAGIFVTRESGRDFMHVVSALASIGQTFPPVAVLAIAVPVVGFGFKPTLIALFIYGLLPVIRNTIAGLDSVPEDVVEAAKGMGMTPLQVLSRVELPLSMPVVMAGVRMSTVINIGTATLGATIGAGGLGAPIIAGIISDNPAYIIEGAVLVGLFAIIVDTVLGGIEKRALTTSNA